MDGGPDRQMAIAAQVPDVGGLGQGQRNRNADVLQIAAGHHKHLKRTNMPE